MSDTPQGWVHTFTVAVTGDPQQVFAALTTPEALTQWFADHVQVDPQVGGAFRFWGRHAYGTQTATDATQRITHVEPPRALGFTWRIPIPRSGCRR